MPRRRPRQQGYHWDRAEPIVRDDGLAPCRFCYGPVTPPRRNWCGRPGAWCLACERFWHPEPGAAVAARCDRCGSGPVVRLDCPGMWLYRKAADEQRRVIYLRDRGVCRRCGVDTTAFDLHRIARQQEGASRWVMAGADKNRRRRVLARYPDLELRPDGTPHPPEHWEARHAEAVGWHLHHAVPLEESPWELDHVVPVADGGDWFSPRNCQTLCVPDHRRKTAAENAGRRAARRAAATPNGSPSPP